MNCPKRKKTPLSRRQKYRRINEILEMAAEENITFPEGHDKAAENSKPVIEELPRKASDCVISQKFDRPNEPQCFEGFTDDVYANMSDSEDYRPSDSYPNFVNAHFQENSVRSSLREQLALWAVNGNIPQIEVNRLLKILREHPCHSSLPKDARELLGTPRSSHTKCVEPGIYIHFGLEAGIKQALRGLVKLPHLLKVFIAVDGLPLTKSSNSQFWPIIGCLTGDPDISSEPFVIGVYHGNAKPHCANDFLREFIDEAVQLTYTGIRIGLEVTSLKIVGIICDAPARSFITWTKGHSGYFSCSKCTQKGIYYGNHIILPEMEAQLRTDRSFRLQHQREHHLGKCILMALDIDMVADIPVEYMHLVCLGCVKKLLLLVTRGSLQFRISVQQVAAVSRHLISLRHFICSEFSRKPRGLKELDRWKATEFRQLLMYTGPLVLSTLPVDNYQHFLTLHVAICILANPKLCILYNDYADKLLKHYVHRYISLYGKKSFTYNTHNLLHLAGDVKTFGSLDCFSAFKFENFMRFLKKSLRKSEKPLQQLACRLEERKKHTDLHSEPHGRMSKLSMQYSVEHHEGPLPEGYCEPQFKKIVLPMFVLRVADNDNCCVLKDGEIVLVENIVSKRSEADMGLLQRFIVGRYFTEKHDFYQYPLNSSKLGIYHVKTLSRMHTWPVEEIEEKCLRLPHGNGFVVLPLIHQQSSVL